VQTAVEVAVVLWAFGSIVVLRKVAEVLRVFESIVVLRKHRAEPFVSLSGSHTMHVCAAKAQLLHSMPVRLLGLQGSLHWHPSSPCVRLQ
jgi:hypothetical protein